MVLSRILPFLIAKLRPNMNAAEAEEIGVLIAWALAELYWSLVS